jgi:hypothetical protein
MSQCRDLMHPSLPLAFSSSERAIASLDFVPKQWNYLWIEGESTAINMFVYNCLKTLFMPSGPRF